MYYTRSEDRHAQRHDAVHPSEAHNSRSDNGPECCKIPVIANVSRADSASEGF